MLKKTITYTDYNGTERTEDFYFNLNKSEVIEMEYGRAGGLTAFLKNILEQKDQPAIMRFVKELILKSYGKKSDDGKRFIKSTELSNEFLQTEAYTNLFLELMTDANNSVSFVKAILPPIPKTDLPNETSDIISITDKDAPEG